VKKYIVVDMNDSLDMNDAHEAHAFFALLFDCENCGRVMGFQSSHTELSDEWYLELAKQAKVEGWYVPPADADGKVDVGVVLPVRGHDGITSSCEQDDEVTPNNKGYSGVEERDSGSAPG
jgi:hypothetical protein